jgi:hypothetical protein
MTDMIDDVHAAPPPETPVDLAALGLPAERILQPGIYFGLDEDTYHGAFGLSYSGIKDFRVSPYLWWSKSPLNPRLDKVLAEENGSSEARTLGHAFDARIICGREYFDQRFVTDLVHADHPDSLRTVDDLKGWLESKGLPKSGKTKDELIDRAIGHDANVRIWDAILDGYQKQHAGKTFLSADWMEKIELAAALIEKHPELSKALKGGAPQVSIVWNCEKTGIPLRARYDYLKQKLIVDLKTFDARGDLPLENAIGKEIGFRKYHIQAAMYVEAAAQIPRFIKGGQVYGDAPDGFLDLLARHPKKGFGWIFQIKGPAPQAFGYILPEQSMLWNIGSVEIDNAKHAFRACIDRFGADPWIDTTGFRNLDDCLIPAWSLS